MADDLRASLPSIMDVQGAPTEFAGLAGNLSWDDLRAFLAVAIHGSMNRAGRALGESQPTIGRRMARLEKALGLTLLSRGANAVHLTETGHAMLRAISPMLAAIEEIGAVIGSHRNREDKPVRVTATTSVAMFLTRHLAVLQPVIAPSGIAILPSRRPFDLVRGEADLALRMRALPKSPQLLVRKLGKIGFSLYGVSDDPALPVILPSSHQNVSRQFVLASRALECRSAGPEIDEVHLRHQAIAAGVGIGSLPCWIGDGDPRLVRIEPKQDFWFAEEVFLVRPRRSRGDGVIDALVEALGRLFREKRFLLAGMPLPERQ